MTELSALATASKFGQVFPLQKVDWSRDVTDVSKEAYVVVNMISSNTESRVAADLCRQLAAKFGDIKFTEISAQLAVENYPEENCPSILVYRNGDIQKQFITLKELKGVRTTVEGKVIRMDFNMFAKHYKTCKKPWSILVLSRIVITGCCTNKHQTKNSATTAACEKARSTIPTMMMFDIEWICVS